MAFGSTRGPQNTIGTSLCERVGDSASQGRNSSVKPAWERHPHLFYPWEFGEEPWEFRLGNSGAERLVGEPGLEVGTSDAGRDYLGWIECSELAPDSDSDEQLLRRFPVS